MYLRAWGDRFHHTLELTEGPQPGLGHVGWRAAGPEELETAVERLSAAGAGEAWVENSVGHGRAFRYRAPGGHLHEVFWEVERYSPPPGMESPFPNRPQRYVPRGIAARCIDHVTITAANPKGDAEWYRDTTSRLARRPRPMRPSGARRGFRRTAPRSWGATPCPTILSSSVSTTARASSS